MTPVLPLSGIRVLDLASELTAYGTRLLADLGAEVLALEPPGGHRLRRKPPYPAGVDVGYGLAFAYYFANKRGITLDITDPAALPLLAELARDVDVVVASPDPGAPVVGFDPSSATLSWAGLGAIVCLVTPFGLTGPYRSFRATHLTLHAMSGGMHSQGPPDGPPLVIPGEQKYPEVGAHLTVAVLAALRERDRVGGQRIELSAHEVLTATDSSAPRYSATTGLASRGAMPSTPPAGVWQCRNGPVEFQVWTDRHWHGFLELIGDPEALRDKALSQPAVRTARAAELAAVIEALIRDSDRHELVRDGQRLGVPCGLLYTVGQFTEDEQVTARGYLATVGPLRMPGAPFRSTVPLLAQYRRPAPEPGEHNREVYLDRLGHRPAELAGWQEAGLV
jgi:crotonobetainyl-CoA:carnitine CoA-transferase CaiB-like acyl-CoA transferase